MEFNSTMEKLTYLTLANKIIEEIRKPLSSAEIWQYATEKGYVSQFNSVGKTPWNTIGAQLYISIRDDSNSPFYQFSTRPAKFFLKSLSDIAPKVEDDIEMDEATIENKRYYERDVHPVLVKFCNSHQHFKAHLKTIYHENSVRKRSGYNEWLHPDLVGVYYPFEKDMDKNALELQKTLSLSSTRIFSFELKKELTWSNLRQCYFQAVSNSSWAHEGYLVAIDIREDQDFMDELRRLNNAFGIGIIKLNPEMVYEGEILFPARTNTSMDWETINRLIQSNSDFKDFIQGVTKDANITEVRKERYDEVLSDTQFDDFIKQKNIL